MPRVVPAPAARVENRAQDKKVPRCTTVILGAGGDLMKRKLLPAIYSLAEQRLLPDSFALVGLGRDQMDEEAFRTSMREALGTSDEIKSVDEEAWSWLASRTRYAYGDLGARDAYDAVKRCLDEIEAPIPGEDRNRVFYLAIPPSIFETTVEHLSSSGLAPGFERK